MTPPSHLDVDRVVLEVPHLGYAQPPWRWFEVDLDRISNQRLGIDPGSRAAAGIRVSAMTRRRQPEAIGDHLSRPRSTTITHLQFEVADPHDGRRAATAIRRAHLTPLPAIHLPHSPARAGELERALDLLTHLDAPLIKLAYPAPDPVQVQWGISLLTSFTAPGAELALIPMGSGTGRAAALAAGSRLIWVPPRGDRERWGADQLLPLLTPHDPSHQGAHCGGDHARQP